MNPILSADRNKSKTQTLKKKIVINFGLVSEPRTKVAIQQRYYKISNLLI